MLEVHPPHSSTHSWRDFFIHIGTIAVGLLLALGLEQGVEAIHRHRERVRLLADLREESTVRAKQIQQLDRSTLVTEKWLSSVLRAALDARSSAGTVSFTIPARPDEPAAGDVRPANAVWAAARSSGLMNVLSREEIETWEHADYSAELVQRDFEASQAAFRSFGAVCEHLGASFRAGARVQTTSAGRDEFTRALGVVIVSLQVVRDEGGANVDAAESASDGDADARQQKGASAARDAR